MFNKKKVVDSGESGKCIQGKDININTSINLAESSKDMFLTTNDLYNSSKKVYESSFTILEKVKNDEKNISLIDEKMDSITKETEKINQCAINTSNQSKRNIELVNEGKEKISVADEDMKSVMEVNRKLLKISEELCISLSEIFNATEYIKDIANKTNLLSLNASIEAARAGDAGRGFSVVAGEIKKLSLQSKTFSENISKIVTVVEGNVKNLDSIAELSRNKIESANNIIDELNKSLDRIEESSSTLDKRVDDISKLGITIIKDVNDATKVSSDLIKSHNQTYAEVQNISLDINNEWGSIENFKIIADKISKVSNDFLEETLTDKINGKLEEIVNKIISYTGDKSQPNLIQLCNNLGINELYYSDETGTFKNSTSLDAIGLNIFEIESSVKEFYIGDKPYRINPLSRRLDTGELYKFITIRRTDSKGIISAGISINNLLKLQKVSKM